jgi:hypothetical protein
MATPKPPNDKPKPVAPPVDPAHAEAVAALTDHGDAWLYGGNDAPNPLATGAAGLAIDRPSRFREVHIVPPGAGGGGHEASKGSGGVVPLKIVLPATQSVDAFEVVTAAGVPLFSIDKNGLATSGSAGAGTISAVTFNATAAGAALAFATPSNAATITGAGDAVFNSVTGSGTTLILQANSINLRGLPSGTPRLQIEATGQIVISATDDNSPALQVNAVGANVAFTTASNAATITGAGDATFNTITAPGLPSVAPAAGSKKFWYDPADSNRVKFAV